MEMLLKNIILFDLRMRAAMLNSQTSRMKTFDEKIRGHIIQIPGPITLQDDHGSIIQDPALDVVEKGRARADHIGPAQRRKKLANPTSWLYRT